jgi:hypothetical protein
LKPPRLNTVWPVPALIDTACADLSVACGLSMLRAQWAWRYQTRGNPRIEIADQGPTSPRGSGETVRMGAAATISLPQTSRLGPSWLAAVWSSGFGGAFEFPMRPGCCLGLLEEGGGVLLHQAVQRGPLWAVVLVVNRGAVRCLDRGLSLPTNGSHALPKL